VRETENLSRELESVKDPLDIEEIDWSHDDSTAVPESVCKCTNLKKLALHACAYTSLPLAFGNLQKLEEEDIGFCKQTYLPPTFGSLQRLRRLKLMSNRLTALPESFSRLKALDCLFVPFNELETLPEDFGDLEALDFFDMAQNKLKSIPESFGKLAKLTGCSLSWNSDMTSLPASFTNLAKLRWLEVKGIPGLKFNESVSRLPSLQYIYLDENQASIFPENLKSALNSRGCKVFYEKRIDDPYDDDYRTETIEL
jgi:Leucine-rich repeat (LRR) protein